MSDVEDDLEFYTAFEDELYKETSTVESDNEIDSELEAALYQNVHFASSFVITPSKQVQEENDIIIGDPKLLDSSADECEPSNTNSGSVGENETQDISKYPEVALVFSNEKNIPKSSKSKGNAAILHNPAQTTDGNAIDTEDGLKTNNDWGLIEADLMPAVLHAKGNKRRSSYIRCCNCNEKGHRTFECTQPKKDKVCFLCGAVGHLKQECPNELCFNCNEPGHQFRQCRKARYRHGDICRRCHAYGHFQNFCPDKWRQYHFTIKPGKLVLLETQNKPQNDKIFCYNCGAEGHLGHECLENRPDGSFAGSYPFVVKYDTFTTAGSPGFPNRQNHQHQEREHLHFNSEKRRKTGNMEDRREDYGQQGGNRHWDDGGDNWNTVGQNGNPWNNPLESTEFTDMSEVVDGAKCSFGDKRGKKRKSRKNKAKFEGEPVEDNSKNGGRISRKRKRGNKTEMLQVDYNEDMTKNSLVNTWNVAPSTKKKRNQNRKKNKINNGAIEPNVHSHPVLTFEEQAPSTETKTKLHKSQKKHLSQPKPRKRTETKKIRKAKKHNYTAKTNPSRRVYFDFNGFV